MNPNNFGVLQIAISEFGATNKIRNFFFANQEKPQSKREKIQKKFVLVDTGKSGIQ